MPDKRKDEDKLRKRIVSALRNFLKDDPRQKVKNVHGISEFGIDIEFYVKDFSDQLHCYGMQVKSGDLNCKSSPTKGVKEIIGQLAVASGKKSIHQADNEYDFSAFYVVVEGQISDTAERFIRSAFNNSKPIHFLYGEKLEKFLKDFETGELT
jgi:hypothetical protein